MEDRFLSLFLRASDSLASLSAESIRCSIALKESSAWRIEVINAVEELSSESNLFKISERRDFMDAHQQDVLASVWR